VRRVSARGATRTAEGYTFGVAVDVDDPRSVLLAVGSVAHREIAMEELLERMVDAIARSMKAHRGTIYLLDRGKRELVSKAAHLPELEEIRLALGQGIAGHVAATGKTLNVADAQAMPEFFGGVDERTGYRTESSLAAPMRDHEGEVLGVIQLLNKAQGSFTAEDARRLEGFAAQAGLILEATTMYEALSRTPESTLEPLPIVAQFNRIVGDSERLRQACKLTLKAAASHATVLLRGESGTGKELFARAVHVNSPRGEGPFVKIDCAALPESLIDNELFGHERGAYTGADARALGKFDAAKGGTLFLDELGELPLAVQGKLLRVLQDREFLRIGGTVPIATDVRIVAATNRCLEQMVADGRFREDLYFRVKVVELALPPLRERGPRDIERLAQHFVLGAAKRHGRAAPVLTNAALARLCAYPWPGNVRELENCIESAVVVAEAERIEPSDLPLPDRLPVFAERRIDRTSAPTEAVTAAGQEGRPLSLEEVERRHILAVLERAGGNQSVAAELLGIGRNTLARKLKGYGALRSSV
jgi:Nif-specific regulatory protein